MHNHDAGMPTNPLHACHCFAARQAARHLTRIYDRHLAAAGLTSTQFSILVVIHTGQTSMRGLADTLVMDRTTLLRALKPLQEQGLVASARHADDARQIVFSLPPAARRLLKRAAPLWENAQHEFEQTLGKTETRTMRGRLLEMTRGAAA